MKEKAKTIEQRYVHLEQRDQILLRPDTQIGTVLTEDRNLFVVDDVNNIENISTIRDFSK
jgi:hypothetical protein